MEKFLGIGLKKGFALGLFMILFFVAMKAIFTKYEIPGVSDVVKAA